MKLYFHNSYDEERLIGEPVTEKEAIEIINKFLRGHNFISFYTRTWEENNRKWFDVGSHSEFFILDNC